MTDYAELLERVKAANEPNWELDIALLHLWQPDHDALRTYDERYSIEIRDGVFSVWKRDGGYSASSPFPRFTGSIDASLALVARCLQGWVCEVLAQDAVGSLGDMEGIGWTAEFSNGLDTIQGQAETLPLAIITSLLYALKSQAEK